MRIVNLKRLIKISNLLTFLLILINQSSFSKTVDFNYAQVDSMQLLAQYSLFAEYYKNKDYKSAIPYGWNVIKMNPEKFSNWIYYKMENAYWYEHDSTNISDTEKKQIADTLLTLYNDAAKYHPEDKGYFEVRKAYVEQKWLNENAETVINDYQQAFKDNPKLPSYYYDQLGQLYKANMSSGNDYRQKAVDLYSMLSDKEPNNDLWPDRLQNLVKNISDLVPILKNEWEKDKNNPSKAWKYASMAIQAKMYNDAIPPLEFLVQQSPKTVNYWEQLAEVYRKTNQNDKAADAYKKLIVIDPKNKNHYLNLGIIYSDEGKYSDARDYYLKASQVGNGWALPIYYEGLLYEQSATKCNKFDFNAKLVYQLALDTYRKAKNMDPSLTQADDRIKALASSVPTKEDYFFRGLKPGQSVKITGDCYTWIDRSITVP
jgi:TPR repeat